MKGIIYQINVKHRIEGELGIPKRAVECAQLYKHGFEGDYNVFRTRWKFGTLNRAVLLLPIERLIELDSTKWPVKPGDLGENITTKGISYDLFSIGQRYQIGRAVIEITEQAKPCKHLKVLDYIGESNLKRFVHDLLGRRGLYAKVITEGLVTKKDEISLL